MVAGSALIVAGTVGAVASGPFAVFSFSTEQLCAPPSTYVPSPYTAPTCVFSFSIEQLCAPSSGTNQLERPLYISYPTLYRPPESLVDLLY